MDLLYPRGVGWEPARPQLRFSRDLEHGQSQRTAQEHQSGRVLLPTGQCILYQHALPYANSYQRCRRCYPENCFSRTFLACNLCQILFLLEPFYAISILFRSFWAMARSAQFIWRTPSAWWRIRAANVIFLPALLSKKWLSREDICGITSTLKLYRSEGLITRHSPTFMMSSIVTSTIGCICSWIMLKGRIWINCVCSSLVGVYRYLKL